MVDYALHLTRAPGAMRESDVARLRDAGFDDAAVLDIAQVTAYYNYVNRLADGLGVELEDYWTMDDLTLSREEMEGLARSRRADVP
jgi:uncharacterized peroxidase-related enzyme